MKGRVASDLDGCARADRVNTSASHREALDARVPFPVSGGEGGIRTLEGLAPLAVFKTAAFNRSATSPRETQRRQGYLWPAPFTKAPRSVSNEAKDGSASSPILTKGLLILPMHSRVLPTDSLTLATGLPIRPEVGRLVWAAQGESGSRAL